MANTDRHTITVQEVQVQVVRKAIKHLHLAVYPPDGMVRVSVPLTMSAEAIRMAVINRLDWIRKHQKEFRTQERQSERSMVNGETVYWLGQRYRLDVIPHKGAGHISLSRRGIIDLYARLDSSPSQRETILYEWYRAQLKAMIPALLEKWETAIGVSASSWGVKRMKTRWGTCSIGARRIWINLELAKKPEDCLEYVIVHELAHLIERKHNERFTGLMDLHIPLWRNYREVLNRAPLAHEEWDY